MIRPTSPNPEARRQRLCAVTPEAALIEAEAMIGEMHVQLDRANAAAVRMARAMMAERRARAA